MANIKKFKIIMMLTIAVLSFLAAAVATYTWYVNQNVADTNFATVGSSTTPSLFAGFPDGELNTEKYYGQTGIQYNGEDYPYILTYSPVTVKPEGLDETPRYITAGLEGLKVILSGKDEHGQPIEEIYLANDEIGQEMLSHFTFRMNMFSYFNGITDVPVNINYKQENGFLVNASTGAPLLMEKDYEYFFELQIIFQSETGYNLLQTTQADISASYIFPLSNQKYMFSNIKISLSFGLKELYKVNLNPNGGTCSTSYLATTGNGLLSLPVAERSLYTFNGWYYDEECTIPFLNNSLKNNAISSDMTVYAGWTAMPKITFNYNWAGYTPATTTTYITKGTKITKPADPTYSGVVFVGWSENQSATYVTFAENEYDFNTIVNADKTLYGVWRRTYTFTLNVDQEFSSISIYEGRLVHIVNGVETVVSTDVYPLTVLEGETFNSYFVQDSDYYRIESAESKDFVHWSTTESQFGKRHDNTTAYNGSQPITGNVTLYAYYRTF